MQKVISWFKGLFTKKYEIPPVQPIAPDAYRIALGEIGEAEVPGPGNNSRIVEYHGATVLKSTQDSVSWCAAFVCWCLERAKVRSPMSARARDFMKWGVAVQKPYQGCVVVFSRPPNPEQGHVGFFVKEYKDKILVLGGNQSDQVCIAGYPKDRLLGYREP